MSGNRGDSSFLPFYGVFQLCCPLYESHGKSGGFAKLMMQPRHSNEAEDS